MTLHRLNRTLFGACAALGMSLLPSCAQPNAGLIQVLMEATDDCVIRPDGEFCDDPDGLPGPKAVSFFFAENEDRTTSTWVIDGKRFEATGALDETEFEFTILSRQDTNECTSVSGTMYRFSVTREEVEIPPDLEAGEIFSSTEEVLMLGGSAETTVRSDGPESCGETPFGERTRYELSGVERASI